ncbi:MAG: response regulator [Methanomassiliicoccales archaeon]
MDADGVVRILIVDDNPEHIELSREYLSDDCFSVDSATSFEEGLDKLKRGQYDLAVLDYDLHHRTGMDLFDEISRLGIDLKVIFVTGYDDPDLSFEARRKGACDYMVKSFRYFEELGERIKETLEECR